MIEVTIGKALIHEQPKSTYRFYLEVMFGDADGDDTNYFDAVDPKEFEPVLNILKAYQALGWNPQCDINSSRDWLPLAGLEKEPHWNQKEKTGLEEAFETLMSLIPGDPCSDGEYQGSPDKWWISYFDENGQEHECSYKIDGKEVSNRRDY